MEVLVSIVILTVGLLGMAALVCSTLTFGTGAKYMNMASVLASDKLDGLNKLPSSDPELGGFPLLAPVGALAGPVNCAVGDAYCDQVTVSETNGANYLTQTQLVTNAAGVTNTVTSTIVHTNTGCVDTPANCGVPNPTTGGSKFTRRWLITPNPVITSTAGANVAVTGARRITVLVTLIDQSAKNTVQFQMSMVRP
jgi:Tfp pilus assembly protein PilV